MSANYTLRVLIIEDDALVALDLENIFTRLGHRVVQIVATEDDAVAAARAHLPDLLTVDIRLRQGTGTAAVSRILAERPVAHLYVTGSPVELLDREAALVPKPFSRRALLAAVEKALANPP